MTKHAVGVNNGNWRAGAYFRYTQEVSRDNGRTETLKVCQEIRDMMTQEQYNAWWEAAPSKGFLEHAKAKLAEMQAEPHPVDVARAMDYDTDAEAREIAAEVERFYSGAEVQEFTQDDERERQDLYTMGMGG